MKTLPYIYSEISYKKCNDIAESIKRTYDEYFENKPITFEDSVHISDSKEHVKKHSVEVYRGENKDIYYFDHRYFSGLFFMLIGKHLFNLKPVNIMKEIYIPFLTEWYIIKFCIYMLFFSYENNDLQMVKDRSEIQRERFYFDLNDIKIKGKRKYKVIYNILSYIHTKSKLKRKLKVLIPVAFEASKNRYNNVGGIFIYFDGDFNNMVQEIESKKYHALATNIIQRFTNSGKTARKIVDVVLSCGCFEGGSDIIDDFYVTFENIADYPIYCLSTTFDSKVKATITWMCKLE